MHQSIPSLTICPLARPLGNVFDGLISYSPPPRLYKQAKTHPRGIFLNYSQYNMKKWDKNHEMLLTSSIYKQMKRAATHLLKEKVKIGLFQNYRTFTLIEAPTPPPPPLSMNFRISSTRESRLYLVSSVNRLSHFRHTQ